MHSEEEIKVLVVEPGRYPREHTMPDTYAAFHELIGGTVEFRPFDDEGTVIAYREGRETQDLPSDAVGIRGTYVLTGGSLDKLASVRPAQIVRLRNLMNMCACLSTGTSRAFMVVAGIDLANGESKTGGGIIK